MQNGLYGVRFMVGHEEKGTGVAVIYNGKVQGGDAALYYDGTYSLEGERFAARIATGRYASNDYESIFGIDDVTLDLRGEWRGKIITAEGTSPQAPGLTFMAHLKLLKE